MQCDILCILFFYYYYLTVHIGSIQYQPVAEHIDMECVYMDLSIPILCLIM